MNNKHRALLKTLHVLSACLWLGAASSALLLHCSRGWSPATRELASLNLHLSVLDFGLIIPGAMGSALSGFFICRTSSWGFFRYRWVTAKWIVTSLGILVGSALLGPWQMKLVELSNFMAPEQTMGAAYGRIRVLFTAAGILQVTMLVMTILISVRKPWGARTRRRAAAAAVRSEGALAQSRP